MTITECIEEIDNKLYGMIDECTQIPEDERDEIKNKMDETIELLDCALNKYGDDSEDFSENDEYND